MYRCFEVGNVFKRRLKRSVASIGSCRLSFLTLRESASLAPASEKDRWRSLSAESVTRNYDKMMTGRT